MPKNLIKGFKHFIKDHHELMTSLVEDGQDPDYFIISCIDSRANAGTIFHVPPGTYFAHKAMGAIVRPYKQGTALSAALQFALLHNNVKTIIIMGHTGCGAVKALIDDIDDPEISSFVSVAQTALHQTRQDQLSRKSLQRSTEENILKLSLDNLKNYPSVQKRLLRKDLNIKAWLFDMHESALHEYDESEDTFNLLASEGK